MSAKYISIELPAIDKFVPLRSVLHFVKAVFGKQLRIDNQAFLNIL